MASVNKAIIVGNLGRDPETRASIGEGRSEAWTLGDGSVVVLVSGKTGGVHLSHVEVLP